MTIEISENDASAVLLSLRLSIEKDFYVYKEHGTAFKKSDLDYYKKTQWEKIKAWYRISKVLEKEATWYSTDVYDVLKHSIECWNDTQTAKDRFVNRLKLEVEGTV